MKLAKGGQLRATESKDLSATSAFGASPYSHEQLHQEAYCQTVRRSNRGRKKSTTTLVSG